MVSEAQQQIVCSRSLQSARHAGQISGVVVNAVALVVNVSERAGGTSEAAFRWDSAPQPLMRAADSDAALMRTAGTAGVSGGEAGLSELFVLIFECVCVSSYRHSSTACWTWKLPGPWKGVFLLVVLVWKKRAPFSWRLIRC